MCKKHHHHHDHPHPPQEELDIIDAFIASPTLADFCDVIHQIYSPMDLMDNNIEFRKAVNGLGIYIIWGTHASHKFKHAYSLKFDKDPGCTHTILTDHDLDEWDFSFPWENYDMFDEERIHLAILQHVGDEESAMKDIITAYDERKQ